MKVSGQPVLHLHPNEYHRITRELSLEKGQPLHVAETINGAFRVAAPGDMEVRLLPNFHVEIEIDPTDLRGPFAERDAVMIRVDDTFEIRPVVGRGDERRTLDRQYRKRALAKALRRMRVDEPAPVKAVAPKAVRAVAKAPAKPKPQAAPPVAFADSRRQALRERAFARVER